MTSVPGSVIDQPATQPLPTIFSQLPKSIEDALTAQGITHPTPIQERVYPEAIQGRDIIAQSKTGSGKTLAFSLPSTVRLLGSASHGKPRMLVLCPTRELADQVATVFHSTFASVNIRALGVTGGASYFAQTRALSGGVDVVVGTPGRVVDLLEQGKLDLSRVEIFVLDEVDQMLDFGFAEALAAILGRLPKERQTLFFSATFNSKVTQIANQMLTNPLSIKVEQPQSEALAIEHGYLESAPGKNLEVLMNSLLFHRPTQAIIFCRTKQECGDVHRSLVDRGIKAGVINGDLKQSERSATMSFFKQKSLQILVATDVAARGIDVAGLSHVINFNVPSGAESYTHRAGRTGRAGAVGKAWTIVAPEDARQYEFLMRRARLQPKKVTVASPEEITKLTFSSLEQFLRGEAGEGAAESAPGNPRAEDFVSSLDDASARASLVRLISLRLEEQSFAGFPLAGILPRSTLVNLDGPPRGGGRPPDNRRPDNRRGGYSRGGYGGGNGNRSSGEIRTYSPRGGSYPHA